MHKTHWRLLLAAWFALLLAACGGGSGGDADFRPTPEPRGGIVEGNFPPLQVEFKDFGVPEPAPTLAWGVRPTATTVAAVKRSVVKADPVTRTKIGAGLPLPVQIGSVRDLPATVNAVAMGRMLNWQVGPTGTTAAITFSSDGASALRLGVLVKRLPPAAMVRLYVQGQATSFESAGRLISDGLLRNRLGGDLSDAGRTFWTPAVDGGEVTLEIELPPGVTPQDIELAVPTLSHLEVRTTALESVKIGEAASCNIDVNCVAGVDNLSRATARMVFTEGGSSYLCSGTLLNDAAGDNTPYFHTAYHCISTQTAASSLVTYWFYRSSSCGATTLSPQMRTLNSGATLLYTSRDTDTSFMRLNSPPPAGVAFAGWSSTTPTVSTDVVGIHHPSGDLQKFSQGRIVGFEDCRTVDASGGFSCAPVSPGTGNGLSVLWSAGTTEGGSSGSGLFAAIGGGRYLVGQLRGGSASCSFTAGTDTYGRFDIAYFAAIGRWLSATTPPTGRVPLFRFFNTSAGSHFYTISPEERDRVAASPGFAYEGISYDVYPNQVASSVPVYRFFIRSTGRHFYTASAQERDRVIATQPDYVFEGPVWYAQSVPGGTALPVYRFYSPSTATHFYTISEEEKNRVIQTDPSRNFEGVAYYAWTTP